MSDFSEGFDTTAMAAEMAEPELGARIAVEHAAEDQPQRMRAGFEAPFTGGAAQARMSFQHRCDRDD